MVAGRFGQRFCKEGVRRGLRLCPRLPVRRATARHPRCQLWIPPKMHFRDSSAKPHLARKGLPVFIKTIPQCLRLPRKPICWLPLHRWQRRSVWLPHPHVPLGKLRPMRPKPAQSWWPANRRGHRGRRRWARRWRQGGIKRGAPFRRARGQVWRGMRLPRPFGCLVCCAGCGGQIPRL